MEGSKQHRTKYRIIFDFEKVKIIGGEIASKCYKALAKLTPNPYKKTNGKAVCQRASWDTIQAISLR